MPPALPARGLKETHRGGKIASYNRKQQYILNISSSTLHLHVYFKWNLDKDQRDAKHILEHIFFQVVEFKKLNQEHDIDTTETSFSPF
ncbi:hypothetical protein J4Q44_G00101340 [Coregonus suidteri]|uniref:Uncharacterized protein n=1 Tax=Coregonus suidteri TaxID=861788 RepID=A0AAN8LWV7_9TELE